MYRPCYVVEIFFFFLANLPAIEIRRHVVHTEYKTTVPFHDDLFIIKKIYVVAPTYLGGRSA